VIWWTREPTTRHDKAPNALHVDLIRSFARSLFQVEPHCANKESDSYVQGHRSPAVSTRFLPARALDAPGTGFPGFPNFCTVHLPAGRTACGAGAVGGGSAGRSCRGGVRGMHTCVRTRVRRPAHVRPRVCHVQTPEPISRYGLTVRSLALITSPSAKVVLPYMSTLLSCVQGACAPL